MQGTLASVCTLLVIQGRRRALSTPSRRAALKTLHVGHSKAGACSARVRSQTAAAHARARPGPHHRSLRRRPQRDRDLQPGRRPVRFRNLVDHAVQLPVDGGDPADQRQDRPHDRQRHRRQSAPALPQLAAARGRRAASRRQHDQHRCRPRGHGRRAAVADWRTFIDLRDRVRCVVCAPAGVHGLCSLRRRAEMVHACLVCVFWHGDGREHSLGRSGARLFDSDLPAGRRVLDDRRRGAGDHHQPVSVFLAGGAGGRGYSGRARTQAAREGAAPGAGRDPAHPAGHLRRNGVLQSGGARDHRHHRGDAPRRRNNRHLDLECGSRGAPAGGRAVCVHPVRPRNRRDRPARGPGVGGISGLCHRRGAPVARRSRPQAAKGQGLLCDTDDRDHGRGRAQLFPDQPDQGALLERGDQRRGGGAGDGGHDAHDRQSEGHGEISRP